MPVNQLAIAPAATAAPVGKASAVHAAPAASHADSNGTNPSHAFGKALDDAMQGHPVDNADKLAPPSAAAESAHAVNGTNAPGTTCASNAVHAASTAQGDDSRRDDERLAEAGQLDGGLLAFVNSLQTPVTAMALPPSASAAPALDSTSLSAQPAEPDRLAALAADTQGNDAARALWLADKQGGRTRDATELSAAADLKPVPSDPADAQAFTSAIADTSNKPERQCHTSLQDALLTDTSTVCSGLSQALASAAAAGTVAASVTTTAATPSAHVAPHMHAPQWQDAFGQQVLWMARSDQQMASLTMNPPELGPVRVTLSVIDGQASASFVSLQPEVRQAIQEAVPRLKEMFADAGLQLQQASVGNGDPGSDGNRHRDAAGRLRDGGEPGGASALTSNDDDTADKVASLRTAHSIASSRLVDLFA